MVSSPSENSVIHHSGWVDSLGAVAGCERISTPVPVLLLGLLSIPIQLRGPALLPCTQAQPLASTLAAKTDRKRKWMRPKRPTHVFRKRKWLRPKRPPTCPGNGNGCALSAPHTCSGTGNGGATSANFTGNRTEGALTHVFQQGARLQAYSETGSAA